MKIKLAIIRGGKNNDKYHLSIKSGAYVMQSLLEDEFDIKDVLIDKSGQWFADGIKIEPASFLQKQDIVLDFSRSFDIDFVPSQVAKKAGVPYIGAGAFASFIARAKSHAKSVAEKIGIIHVPKSFTIYPKDFYEAQTIANEIFKHFPPPYVIKSLSGYGSSFIKYVPSLKVLPNMLEESLKLSPVLVEEYVFGKDYSLILVENVRGQKVYDLPVTFIKHTEKVLTTDIKHSTKRRTQIFVPTDTISNVTKKQIIDFSKQLWTQLHIKNYAKFDFRISPLGKVYFLEVNITPAIYKGSVFDESLDAVGITTEKFFKNIIYKKLFNKNIL